MILLPPDKVCKSFLFLSRSLGLSLMLGISQGEVYIRGKKRAGLTSDEEVSGLCIGLVSALFMSSVCLVWSVCIWG